MKEKSKISVLFVCMGNICRSPTAEGVFRKLVIDADLDADIAVDSAGTHAYHINEPPDRRARAAAERRGFPMDNIRARRVSSEDYERFDYILAMDEDNLSMLKNDAPEHHQEKVMLFLEFAEASRETEVPDPYYGGDAGFERVLDLVEEASWDLLQTLVRKHRLA